MYFKIKQPFTIRNAILFLQKHFKVSVIIFYLLISLACVVIEAANHNYFSPLKRQVIGNDLVMNTILLPLRCTNLVTNAINTYFFKKYEVRHFTEQNMDAQLTTLQQENSHLKSLLNFVQNNSFQVITTEVIWQIRNNTSHYGIINIGKAHGVKNGQAVINNAGLVGKIINAEEDMAEILFIDSTDFRAAVTVGNNGDQAILTGAYNEHKLRLKYLPENSLISLNDPVTTMANYPNFKGGILVGYFESPDIVTIPINWSNLQPVSIVIPSTNN